MIKDCICKSIEENLSAKRRRHTYAVEKEACSLAIKWNVSIEKAEIAALCHDLCRGLKIEASNDYVDKYGLDKHCLDNQNLAHGKIAAIFIKETWNIQDEDILNAVKNHTTGRANMSDLEKIIYLADAIEPNRNYPSVEELRGLAYRDLEQACLFSLNHTINYVIGQGNYLDENTLFARDSIKDEIERRGK